LGTGDYCRKKELKASTVEVMPEIPNSPEDGESSKKNKKYIGRAVNTQKKDKLNITGSPRSI
jgi:hypothetical protein